MCENFARAVHFHRALNKILPKAEWSPWLRRLHQSG